MVGHQTVRIDLVLKAPLPFTKVIEVVQIVISRGEDHLPVVSSLNDMMRVIGDYDPCASWHHHTLLQISLISKAKINLSPFSRYL